MSSRRVFLRQSAATLGTLGVAGPLHALLSRGARANETSPARPLASVTDENTGLELVKLPRGFRCVSYGWTGETMSDGRPTPPLHDGMAVIREHDGRVTICRNHEVSDDGPAFGPPELTYDPHGRAGCTNLVFDTRAGRWLESRVSISGTVRNCAGGPTPWNSWLTCEETVDDPSDVHDGVQRRYEQTHGWIFEVPADGRATPEPLKDMGRFVHEAVAVDPRNGVVYETEDRHASGFYRFLPRTRGKLADGGRLQMLKVRGRTDLRSGVSRHATYDVEWVDVEDPHRAHSPNTDDTLGVYSQGHAQGGATFARLEGCWYEDGRIVLVSTSGGDAQCGQVWSFRPAEQTLELVFESPKKSLLNMPDNVTVHPHTGDVLLCEDSDTSPQRIQILTPDGRIVPFAENDVVLEENGRRRDYRKQEWCGATFDSTGTWLFVNVQTPGITLAITGPWESLGGGRACVACGNESSID